MANTFTSYANKDVGTTAASVVTVGAGTQTTVIGMSIANTTSTTVAADVYFTRSAVDYYLVKNVTVPTGGALVVIGGDQKVVLTSADVLKVKSSVAASLDVVTSVLNIT
jgi:hypothetical protein